MKQIKKIEKLTGQDLYCYKGYDKDGFFIADTGGIVDSELLKNHILVMKDKINELVKTVNLLSKTNE